MVLTLLPSAPDWKPWESEPDELDGERAGYLTRVSRHESSGHLCGYVKLPLQHPVATVKWDDWSRPSLSDSLTVHGGVTAHWEKDDLFWVGFDCAHYCDFAPYRSSPGEGVYRDIEYVQQQVESLADQLALYADLDRALGGV